MRSVAFALELGYPPAHGGRLGKWAATDLKAR